MEGGALIKITNQNDTLFAEIEIAPTEKVNLKNMFVTLFIISIVVFIYLLYVLLKPEKF